MNCSSASNRGYYR